MENSLKAVQHWAYLEREKNKACNTIFLPSTYERVHTCKH